MWPFKQKNYEPKIIEKHVAYVSQRGKVIMWPDRVDPGYAYNVYGMRRMPHLDEPGAKQVPIYTPTKKGDLR